MDVLTNSVQAYPWGSTTALPALLGRPPTGEPQAELWVGAHERSPSRVTRNGVERALDDVISADPVGELGQALAGAARLPFLLKILAVERPLSLQLHPDAADAARGFAAEEAAGLPADASKRSFSDPWPKPEMLYAITEFSAFCGFAEADNARQVVEAVGSPQLQPVSDALRSGGESMRRALEAVLRLPGGQVGAVIERIGTAARTGARPIPLSPTLADIAKTYPDDPAVVALLLMRAVTLAPGETLYVSPGQLHCYLSGTACEVQGNSDNVVRAGLTGKHVDLDAVLELADTGAGTPSVPVRTLGVERVFEPAEVDFALAEITDIAGTAELPEVSGPALLMCLEGNYEVTGAAASGQLARGEAAFVSARCSRLEVSGRGILLRLTGTRAG